VSTVDEVKERLDLVDVIASYVPLSKAGRNYKALCPFHSEKTPSFIVFPATQTWKCFGCGAGGDMFNFVMQREGMEFSEALRLLAARAGVSVEQKEESTAEARARDRLRKINVLASEYFHHLLTHADEGAVGREYVQKRGISSDTVQRFQLGYAREDWQSLGNHLRAKGYSWQDLLEAGLCIEREGGGYYDRFRGRLVFPIRDRAGYVLGFGARALDASTPKYLNSPQTTLFDKGSVLYGIDQAKDAIREQRLAVIVEGYMDVLMAHQHGRNNVVASMGTALTEQQIRTIKRLTKNLVLALDADAAGDQATLRGLELAKETFDRRAMPVPTWRGLIRYEGQLDAEIRVATLPKGFDPDEVIKSDVDQWDALVQDALPVTEYYLRAVISEHDLTTAKGKAAAARQVLPLIREIGSAVERRHYLGVLSRLLRVDERVLEQEMGSQLETRQQPSEMQQRHGRLSAQPGLTFGLERYMLVLLLQRPDLRERMDGTLRRLAMDPLCAEDFQEAQQRSLFPAIAAQMAQAEQTAQETLEPQIDPSLRDELDQLLGLQDTMAFLPDGQAELDAVRCVLDLRELRLRRELSELGFLLEDARAQADADAARQWATLIGRLTSQIERVQRERVVQTSLKGFQQHKTSPRGNV